jgi:hypothetical protein
MRERKHFDAGSGEHLGEALSWLLESRHVDLDVKDHFWHIADGSPCDCEEEGRVEAREGRDGTETAA